ncbi:hypothetical protein A2U01_0088856 [Trifolium medium]|uniref:Uncharacterized protein n=1 Tax=Trifolium medium TaxID=97028 RepID=A0A392U4F6_9FABA|nr:hypothetical protein [Trifolium medium]
MKLKPVKTFSCALLSPSPSPPSLVILP